MSDNSRENTVLASAGICFQAFISSALWERRKEKMTKVGVNDL